MATQDNLQAAFAGESQANRKYLAFAEKADKDGFKQVARLFRAVAAAETVHAHSHLRVMGGIKNTAENLQAAVEGENYENTKMYPGFIAEAETEGVRAALISFTNANEAEKVHEGMYRKALESVNGGKDLPAVDIYVCSVCGHTVEDHAPDKCPVCGAAKEKFIKVD
jgi:rubrerythrin